MDKVKNQLAKRKGGSKDFMLNLDSYESLGNVPTTPPQEQNESDSLDSVKEEGSCDTKKLETESETSEGTKNRLKEEEKELRKKEQENRRLRKLQLKEEQDKEISVRKSLA
jgi:hypothetical protein